MGKIHKKVSLCALSLMSCILCSMVVSCIALNYKTGLAM
jgi:hypothetical protein